MEGAKQAEKLLQKLLADGLNGKGSYPDTVTYTNAINAWAQSGDREAGNKAESLLRQCSQVQTELGVTPNYMMYSAVINAWSKSRHPAAAKRVTALLQAMEDAYAQGDASVCPSVVTYASVIDAWARSGGREAPQQAERLLENMKDLSAAGRADLAPNAIVYSTVINVWSKSTDRKAPDRAMSLLEEAITRKVENTVCYNAVLAAFARHGDSSRALSLLNDMKRCRPVQGSSVEPNTVSYSTVLNALGKSPNGGKEAADKAERILCEVENEHRNGNAQVRPNTILYTNAITAMANGRSTESAIEAENILWRLDSSSNTKDDSKKVDRSIPQPDESKHPVLDASLLSAVINCWFGSRDDESPERISYLLEWGRKRNLFDGKDHQYRICINYHLGSLAKSKRPDAPTTIKDMIRNMENTDALPNPDVHSYNHLLSAVAPPNVSHPVLARFRILRLLLDSKNKDVNTVQPNIRTFHLVLGACKNWANGNGQESLEDVSGVLRQMSGLVRNTDGWSPNAMTYQLFFEACQGLDSSDQKIPDEIYQHYRANNRKRPSDSVERAYKALSLRESYTG